MRKKDRKRHDSENSDKETIKMHPILQLADL